MTPEEIRDMGCDRRSADILNAMRDILGVVDPLRVARTQTAPEGVRLLVVHPWPVNIDKRAADRYFTSRGVRLYTGALQLDPYSSAYLLEM